MVGIRTADLGDGRRNSFINVLTIGNFLELDVDVQSGKFVIQNFRARERLLGILTGEKNMLVESTATRPAKAPTILKFGQAKTGDCSFLNAKIVRRLPAAKPASGSISLSLFNCRIIRSFIFYVFF